MPKSQAPPARQNLYHHTRHRTVKVNGLSVGLAVSLGSGFLFFTPRDQLKHFDGKHFPDLVSLREAVVAATKHPAGSGKVA